MNRAPLVLMFLLGLTPVAAAQWPAHTAPNVPRTADGRIDLTAPAPRVDGRVDLSGVWVAMPDPKGKPEGVENDVFPRYMVNIAQDLPPDGTMSVVHPAFRALFQERLRTHSADLTAICKPDGTVRLVSLPLPIKIIQTPSVVVMLYEIGTTFRQIFTDGRTLPDDPQPTFMGYSVGRWDGDAFVVTSSGYNDQTALDGMGHPHSEAMRMTERYHRIDVGHMNVDVTVEDTKALAQPIVFTQRYTLMPGDELLEYYCTENEKDQPHYVTN